MTAGGPHACCVDDVVTAPAAHHPPDATSHPHRPRPTPRQTKHPARRRPGPVGQRQDAHAVPTARQLVDETAGVGRRPADVRWVDAGDHEHAEWVSRPFAAAIAAQADVRRATRSTKESKVGVAGGARLPHPLPHAGLALESRLGPFGHVPTGDGPDRHHEIAQPQQGEHAHSSSVSAMRRCRRPGFRRRSPGSASGAGAPAPTRPRRRAWPARRGRGRPRRASPQRCR